MLKTSPKCRSTYNVNENKEGKRKRTIAHAKKNVLNGSCITNGEHFYDTD